MTTRPHNPDAALPIGIEIGGHAIEAVVAAGPTGFVYLAADPLLARQVAIKEYFPSRLAVRQAGTQMRARSASDHQSVMAGRDAFVEESRLLARIDHPSLVRIAGAHEANQTAYRVMPFHAGPTLAQARYERGVPPGDGWVRRMIDELLGALDALHAVGIVHGHLHPAQVLLRSDDRPLLLGFGAAARVLGVTEDDAYVPPEMRLAGTHLQRGPWTDMHALAALSWFAVMGGAPPVERPLDVRAALDAAFGPPEDDTTAHARERLCAALSQALAPKPADRPQSVADMRSLLGDDATATEDPEEIELPPEPDPRVRAAIAAAIASIPDSQPVVAARTKPAAPARGAPPLREPAAAEASRAPSATVASVSTVDARGPTMRATGDERPTPPPSPRARENRPAASSGPLWPPSQADAGRPSSFSPDPAGTPVPGVTAPAPQADAAEPAGHAWAAPGAAPEPATRDLPSWMADRPADEGAVRKPPLRRRRTGWAWAAALLVGVASGVGAWKWTELQDGGAPRIATAPAAGALPPAAPPVAAAQAEAPAPEPAGGVDRVVPTPVGERAADRQAASPEANRTPALAVGQTPAPADQDTIAPSAVVPGARPSAGPAPAPDAGRQEPGSDSVREPATARAGTGAQARPTSPRPAAARPAPQRAAALPTPRASCGNRTNFSLVYCMQRQCRTPTYSAHPQCREFRRTGEVS